MPRTPIVPSFFGDVPSRSLQALAALMLWTFVCGVLGLSALHSPPGAPRHHQVQHDRSLAWLTAPESSFAPAALAPVDDGLAGTSLPTAVRLPAASLVALSARPRPRSPLVTPTPLYLRQLVLLL